MFCWHLFVFLQRTSRFSQISGTESASKRVSSLENEIGLVSERKKDWAQKNTHFETYTSSPFKWKIKKDF
jgi:hypothetical protein